MDVAKLVARLELQSSQFQTELEKTNRKLLGFQKQTNKSLSSIEKSARSFANTLKASIAGALGGAGFAAIIRNTVEAEKAFAQLEAVVKSTGGVAGFSAQQLADMSGELQKVTTYGDDAVQSMQSVLLTFTKVRGAEFQGAQKAILDIATRLGTDLKGAALQVGKALNDPIKGVSSLSRAGVQLSATQKELIERLQKTGDVAGAQRIILKELETQFGGAAEAARNTFGGALQGVQNAFGDLLEGKSGINGATAALNSLADTLSSESIKAGFGVIVAGLLAIVELTAKAAAGLGNFAAAVEGSIGGDLTKKGEQVARLAMLQDQLRVLENGSNKEEAASLRNEIASITASLDRVGPTRRGGSRNRGAAEDPEAGFVDLSGTDRRLETMRLFQENIKELEFAEEMMEDRAKGMRDARNDLFEVLQDGIEGGVKETADRATDSIGQVSDAIGDAIEKQGEMSIYAEEAARNMQDHFAEFLFDPFEDGLDGMLKGFIDVIRRMVAEAAAAKIFSSTSSGGLGFGDFLGGLFGLVDGSTSGAGITGSGPQMATGTNFVPYDNFPAMLHKGEAVVPAKYNPAAGGRGGDINISIDARGATQEFIKQVPAVIRQAADLAKAEIRDEQRRGKR